MNVLPLRPWPLGNDSCLFVSDTGAFFAGDEAFLDRQIESSLTPPDHAFLARQGHAYHAEGDVAHTAHAHGVAKRFARAGTLDYLILVPTLRCNLSCTYCQVSRAPIDKAGFDWSEETLSAVLALVDRLETPSIKIEFQGGEPTLRPDLLRAVIERAQRFPDRQFVVCTNLATLSAEIIDIFDRPDVFISTSLDGDSKTHARQRTGSAAEAQRFAENLDRLLRRYGPDKIAALPTVDPQSPPEPAELIEAFASRGLRGIYLRPINYQGFARKRHAHSREQDVAWRAYYERFVGALIERNWADQTQVLEETYLSHCLKRIFQPGHDRHVDLRNPNAAGVDYVVIDHDGRAYPTDEARMLARSGVIDLSIGDVATGWDTPARQLLNDNATNALDPECQRCAFQPYCGRDVVDDLARYGTTDLKRTETAFCRRHMHLFDFAFRLIYDPNEAVQYSLRRWLKVPGDKVCLGAVLQ